MLRRIAPVAAVVTLTAGLGAALGATGTNPETPTVPKTYKFTTALTSAQEVPKATAPGSAAGTFSGTVTDAGKLTYKLTFKGLSGPAIAAHIHTGKKGKAGPVAFVICPKTCTSPRSGSATIKKSLVEAMEKGAAYVNVHTTKNVGGEIRAQLTAK